MKLETFRRRFPVKTVRAAGQPWGVIETKGKPGAPILVMLPGTLGTAEIFWNQIVGKLDPAISLGVTLSIIALGVLFSLWKTRTATRHGAETT